MLIAVSILAACQGGNGTDGATDQRSGEQPHPTEFDDDTAATVNGTAIPRQAVDQRVDEVLDASEGLAERLEADHSEQLLETLHAQTLTLLIQMQIILDGAAEMSIEPSDAAVAETREELIDEFGDQQAFDEAVAQAGMSEETLQDQLRAAAVLEAVGDRLVEEGRAQQRTDTSEQAQEFAPAERAVQQWLGELVTAADVAVHPDYGEWNPQSGQVTPPEGPISGVPDAGEMPEPD